MRMLVKGLVFVLSLIILILVLGVAVALLAMNPNNYKGKIIAQVQQATDRPFNIQGDMHWTLFPMFGIKANDITLGNPQNFSSQGSFVTIDSASLNLAIRPLLEGQLRFGALTLNGVNIHLIRNADGTANWQNIGTKPKLAVKQNNTSANSTPVQSKMFSASVSTVTIKNSNLEFDDATSNQHIKINDFNFDTNHIVLDKAFPVELDFKISRPDIPNPVPVKLTSQITINSQPTSATIDRLKIAIANLKITGTGNITVPNRQLILQSKLQIPTFDAKEFLNTIGKPISADALNNASGQFSLSVTPTMIKIQQFRGTIDNSKLQANVTVYTDGSKRINFNLGIDQLNAAQFMKEPTTVALNQLSPISNAYAEEMPSELLPVDTLRTLNMQGTLAVGNLILPSMTLNNLNLTVNAQKGQVDVEPFRTQLYDGTLQGSLNIDVRPATPQWHLVANFNHIDMAALLNSLKKLSHVQISGTGNVAANLTTAGNTADYLTQNLNGGVNFKVTDGVLHGIDILYYSELADALSNQTQPTVTNTNQTAFGDLTGTWQIHNGVASNNDLHMSAPKLAVTGSGTANLLTQQIDYAMQLQRMTSGSQIQPRGPAIPITIKGPFSNPEIRPNWKALTSTVAKKELSKQLESHSAEINKALGDQLGQQVQQGLQALLGN